MRRDSSFRSTFGSSGNRKTRGSYARQLCYESLEDRHLLATSAMFDAGTGELTIKMPLPGDQATLTLLGTNDYEVRNQAAAVVPIAGGPVTFATLNRLTVTGGPGAQQFTLNGAMNPVNGVFIDDTFVETTNLTGDITNTINGVIVVGTLNLNSNIRTDGGAILFSGPVNLLGNVELDTDLVGGTAPAAQVDLGPVNGAFQLRIDATADNGAAGGLITLRDVGAAAPLARFDALTNDRIDFTGGDFILTDGGAVNLQAATLDMAAGDDTIDTEQGADNPGGNVTLDVGLIRNTGATVPHILTIDTRGIATQPKGTVTLPSSGQFVQGAPTAGFTNYDDTLFHRVRIRVAATSLFFENFVNPAANTRFTSTNFTQVGTNFVASPPVGRRAIALINPVQITPAPPLPTTFTLATTATLNVVAGRFINGYVVFDAVDANNFKFAGVFFGRKKFSIGEVKNGVVTFRSNSAITPGTTFNLSATVNTATGNVVLSNNGLAVTSFTFGTPISPSNRVGVGTINANTSFTNIALTA